MRPSINASSMAIVRGRRDRARDHDGFTIVEVLIASVLALVVVVAPLTFLITSLKTQNAISSRAFAARQGQNGLEQLTRDLREAISTDTTGASYSVTVTNPTTSTTAISFEIPGGATGATGAYGIVPDASEAVTWTCPSTGASSAGSCTRTIGSYSRVEITGVNSATFTPTGSTGATMSLPATNPTYINVALSLQVTSQLDHAQTHVAQGVQNPVLVQGGIDLRNES
jgi:Tfp pilus assembly protein PilW